MRGQKGYDPELPQNKQPLGSLARKALLALDQQPEREGLYVLQLVEWCLRERKPLVQNDLEDMLNLVERLNLGDPERALRYLSESAQGPNERLLPSEAELSEAEPSELAALLTFALRDKMMATVPGFPIKRSSATPYP